MTKKPFPKDAPTIKNSKPQKSIPVKYDPHMGVMAPRIAKKKTNSVNDNRA